MTHENARDLWRVLQQPELREFQDIPRTTVEEFERQVRARPRCLVPGTGGRFEWLLRRRELGDDIGWISLRVHDRGRTHAELGYSLLVEARGQGFATEALRALRGEAFDQTDLAEIHACTIPENFPSRAVLTRLGFCQVRVLRGGALVRSRRVDVILHIYTRGQHLAQAREERLAG
ncbi:MAG: GNAT family N-acetyltransferase [Candidatus Eremiobacteraeota bacterium]|nr:GNAT family N-acetyltransferase [Candidatus Eremiobacteraeota bacterium]MBV8354523.1 GNAT family N-acetyltransferase [Candidatus Eremiobacteraeota bacterium]